MSEFDLREILFTTDLSDQKTTCTAWDLRTGADLMTYKCGGIASENGLCFVNQKYVLTANKTKPLIHIWPINSQVPIPTVRFVTPRQVGALAVSPDSNFLVAGVHEGIFIWHINSGKMINNLLKHYQRVSCIRFAEDGSFFASGGYDGGINLWNLTQVVSRSDDNQKPFSFYNDHDLPVTDVHIGTGGLRGNLFSVSLDCSCKMYNISTGNIMLNVILPEALNCIVVNLLETCIYIGSVKGVIHRLRIDTALRTQYQPQKEALNEFKCHVGKVTAMVLSFDGETLITGGEDGNVFVWYIPSAQIIKTITHKAPISNIRLLMMQQSAFGCEAKFINRFPNSLKRMIDLRNGENDFFIEVFPEDQERNSESEDEQEFVSSNLLPFSRFNFNVGVSNKAEACNLRKQVVKLKIINKTLFEEASRSVLHNKKLKKLKTF